MKTTKVSIEILDTNDNTPLIEPTDSVMRLLDGHLIMPFAVQVGKVNTSKISNCQIVDDDSASVQENVVSTAGDAADFLRLEKVDSDLYQVDTLYLLKTLVLGTGGRFANIWKVRIGTAVGRRCPPQSEDSQDSQGTRTGKTPTPCFQ